MRWLSLFLVTFLLVSCDNNPSTIAYYTITYIGNYNDSGSVPADNKSYKEGEIITVKGNSGFLKKTGCTFSGWNTKNNGYGADYQEGDSITMGAAELTLYAKWVVIDIDGNIYNTVTIGTQTWMVENLYTTRYNDGTVIPLVDDSIAWANLTTPGYCYYQNTANADSIKKFGALYNWYAVDTKKLAPADWHAADTTDWNTLENYLITTGYNWDGTTTENKIAKSLAAETDWETSTRQGAVGNDLNMNNRTGFSALPSGCRGFAGGFHYIGTNSIWWCVSEGNSSCGNYFGIDYDNVYLYKGSVFDKECGFSVRLVRD